MSLLPQNGRVNGEVQLQFDAASISVRQSEVRRVLGSRHGRMDDHFEAILADVIARFPELCEAKGGYAIYDAKCDPDRHDGLYVGNRFFATDRIIAAQLKQSKKAAFFACTIGSGMETWSRQEFANGDTVTGHFIDTVASFAVEAVACLVHDHIGTAATRLGFRITNRFSPGYCGWPVEEQQQLFSFFPAAFCGITLTDASLMLPIKSVSGIIGLGSKVSREPYFCERCKMTNCTYRAYKQTQQQKENLQ